MPLESASTGRQDSAGNPQSAGRHVARDIQLSTAITAFYRFNGQYGMAHRGDLVAYARKVYRLSGRRMPSVTRVKMQIDDLVKVGILLRAGEKMIRMDPLQTGPLGRGFFGYPEEAWSDLVIRTRAGGGWTLRGRDVDGRFALAHFDAMGMYPLDYLILRTHETLVLKGAEDLLGDASWWIVYVTALSSCAGILIAYPHVELNGGVTGMANEVFGKLGRMKARDPGDLANQIRGPLQRAQLSSVSTLLCLMTGQFFSRKLREDIEAKARVASQPSCLLSLDVAYDVLDRTLERLTSFLFHELRSEEQKTAHDWALARSDDEALWLPLEEFRLLGPHGDDFAD